MIGNAMRFKLKKTLVGVAALSVLCPMASHADVTPGRWIFDGLGRSTRDGQGSTCVGAGGDTHAFDAVNCTQSASELKQARDAEIAAKKAASEAKAPAKAEARSTARTALPGGQTDGHVSRSAGTRLVDGFGRDCIRDGSGLTPTSPNCSPAPSVGTPRAAPAPVVAAPVAPGSELAPGSKGAYVTQTPGTEIRDGYGRSCIKDGRWTPGLANEECDPGLFSAWRSSQPAEIELAKRVKSAPPEVKWPPEQPAPAPEPAAMAAAPAESSVIDNSLPVFPVTTYALPTDAESDEVDALAADDDDEMDDALADGTDAADDDDAGVAMLADPDEADAMEEESTVAALDEDDDDTVAAFADDDYDDDDSDETVASGGDDVMRDDENLAFAALGDMDDEDDHDADHGDDEEDDLADTAETGIEETDDSLALAALADTDGDGEPDDEALLEDDEPVMAEDEPVMAEDDIEEDTGSRVADSDLAPRIVTRAPEVVRPAPAAVAAPEALAEFPVTKYEYDANAATADTGASALAAAPEEQEPLADGPAEPASTANVAPPKDTPPVAAAEAQRSEPKPVAETASPEVACPPVTIQLEGARFDFDKWILRPQAKEKLDDVAAKLKSHQCEAIDIVGHTDRIGTAKYNQRLSERRANAARDYLIKHHGIEADRVTASGKGESELITKASDCRGKRKKALIACYGPDRRIEVKVRK